jgi:hypothetical protein
VAVQSPPSPQGLGTQSPVGQRPQFTARSQASICVPQRPPHVVAEFTGAQQIPLTQLRPLAHDPHAPSQPSGPHALPAQLGRHLVLARHFLRLALFLSFLQFRAVASSVHAPKSPTMPPTNPLRA